MTITELKQLRALLHKARAELQNAIGDECPADSVPDRVAIPWLNRLERRQIELDQAFDLVLGLLPEP